MNKLKFGHGRRKSSGIHTIKSIMAGRQSRTPISSKRSTQALVNEGSITSIEFTKEDPLEATETSFTSTGSVEACSFASGPVNDGFSDDEQSIDPYLDSDLQRQSFEFHRRQASSSIPLEDAFQLCPDDETIESTAMNHKSNRRIFQSTAANLKSFHNKGELTITTRSQNANQPNKQISNQRKGGTLHTEHTGPESDSDDEYHNKSSPTIRFKSLGTFDFPVTPQAERTSNTKSLGTGSFRVPLSEEEKDSETSFPQDEPSFIHSPILALGKGLKYVSASITIPKVLFSIERDQAPPTPVSRSPVEENPVKSARMARFQRQADLDCEYWNGAVTGAMRSHGKCHPKVAEALVQLGQAYMLAREYAQAVIAFQSACCIWKELEQSEEDQLAFARVVDAVGMAWARVTHEEDKDHCHKAMTALEEAFHIRYELLGPWHVDTVETLNKMASVHLHLREYEEACNAYWEVFWVRKAIFGPDHPSVAIAAHSLGNVFVKLAATEDAAKFFQIAVEIYEKMQLPNKHPAVARLMRDYKRLDRICLTSRMPRPRKAQMHR